MSAMFETATRMKLRFPYSKGSISVEDLWDAPLPSLNTMFKTLNATLKSETEESLLDAKTKNPETELQVEIIRHVVAVRLAEQKEKEVAAEKATKRKFLMNILAEKQESALKNMSEEEIKNMLASL